MTINFTKNTFYQYNKTEGYFDSGQGWNQFKKILDDSPAFDNLLGSNKIKLFLIGSNFKQCDVKYNQSYFD